MESKELDNGDTQEDRRRSSHTKMNFEKNYAEPVDRGWAWFIMFGAFINLTMIMFFIRSTSILFIHFLDKYQESATMTTMAFGFSSAMFALCNIFGPTFLLPRFEVRTLTVVGAIINFLGIFGIAFAPNMIVIDIMMAFMGFSHGLISVPQMTLIGRYFKKRLSFATAFVNLAISIATIAAPPLIQFLLVTYGLRGTIMILAGINMNCIPASMLLRPFTIKQSEADRFQGNNAHDLTEDDTEDIVNTDNTTKEHAIKDNVYKENDKKSEKEMVSLINANMKPRVLRSISGQFNNDLADDDTSNCAFMKSDIDIKVPDHRESLVFELIDRVSISSNIRYLSDPHIFIDALVSKENIHLSREYIQMEELNHTGKFASNDVETRDSDVKYISNESFTETSNRKKSCWTKVSQSISKSIYTQPLALLILLACGLGVHLQTLVAYMPAAGKENGLTDDQIPFLVTIIGVSDLVSKLVIGVFADLGYVRRIHIAVVSQIIAGTLSQFIRFFQGFGLMILLQILLGMTGGVMHAMSAVIIVDILGLKYMGHIMAGYFLVNGIILTIEHIVIGTIKDLTGSFLLAYNYIGSFILISATLLLLEPLVAKLKPFVKS